MRQSEEKILSLLLAGRHPKARKYAGKHVLVIENEVFPLRTGKAGVRDMEKLEKKYGRTPTIVFIPRPDISYILVSC